MKVKLLVALAGSLLVSASVRAAIFTVVNTNSIGAGSLSQAITDANASAGDDVISFAITNLSLTIRPSAALPTIVEPVTIDGRSQSGFVSAPIVEISGGSAGAAVDGLKIATSNSVISALVINGFLGDGIEITNGANNIVEGCYIGLNRTGATDAGNTLNGVLITNAPANIIGGLGSTNRNFISGNNQSGIAVGGLLSASNSILGNVIGLNATNNAIANSVDGIRVNAPFTTIGGSTTAARNIISGNTGDGIESVAPLGTNCVIRGNWIGVDTNGVLDRGNTVNGILAAAGAAIIGGSGAGEGNLISGNNDDGIELNGVSSTNHLVLGNVIGSSSAFAAGVINAGNGILITTSSRSNVIGGILAGEANTIYFNGGDGIGVAAANANTNNAFRGNLIFGNTASGIDLGASGITVNDIGDADVGANQLQNFPVLTSVSNTATEVFITGTLNSRPSTTYAIDFFSSIEADAVMNGEGQFYIGSTNLGTAADSNLAFTVSFPIALQGRHVSATATDPSGNTSEFSAAAASVSFASAQTFTVVNTNDSGAGSLREAIIQANLAPTTGSDTINFAITNLSTTISPSSALPALTDPVTIDGYTQSGSVVNTSSAAFNGTVLVRIAGASAGSGANGLAITTSNCVVRGLMITGFTGTGADGIEITGPGGNTVEGCLIGIDSASTDQGNAANGVFISSSPNNIIGGTTASSRNVISGNQSDGVEITGGTATGNQVLGNLIGTGLFGTTAVANSADGILVNGSGATIIGGSAAGAGNLISGNSNDGIELTALATTNTTVLGNLIGTEITGVTALANGVHGVNINGNSRSNIIGGVIAGEANSIAFNGQDGVNIAAANANTNNAIRGNSIFSNGTATGELGIDLGAAGVGANDGGDPDVGANQLQNYPVLAWVTNTMTETVISGSLNSKPATTYAIDFYANTETDTDGFGEGRFYLGSTNLSTLADSNVTFTISLPVVSLPGRYVTATATDPFGNTSEFGAHVTAVSTVPGTTFTVVNTNDSGAGSLRQAILDANANISAGDTIDFAITNLSTTISPSSALPSITDPVTIDGYTQPGAAVNTSATIFNGTVLVRIAGASAGSGANGLTLAIGNNTVRGLMITGFIGSTGDGIEISGAGGNVIEGCLLGVDGAGTDQGNAGNGILISGSPNNIIGGTPPAARNVISGNNSDGIEINGAGATGNQVLGNLIGSGLTGATAVVNTGDGVLVTGAGANIIGGAAVGAGNLISGNNSDGIELTGLATTSTVIFGNRIGTDVSGAVSVLNGVHGININTSSRSNVIGGVLAGEANTIAFNGQDGVNIAAATANTNNVIRGNSIFSNGTVSGELGIDLGAAGVTANDAGDPDTGANQLQNFPVLAWVTNTVSETTLSGSLNSRPSTTYAVDFYASVAPDTDGVGEGQYYLGTTNLTTGADSNLTFTVSLPVASLPARYITATATDPFGNTSEFGTNVFAQSTTPGATFTVVNTNDSGAGSLRQAILDANANVSAGDTIAFAITNLSTVIFPATALPAIIDPVTIDGYTQPGAVANASSTAFNGTVLVRIDGSSAPSGTDGLRFTIGDNTVRGLAIFDFIGTTGDGLDFSGGGNNTIQGCIIGLDVDGLDRGNGGNGILITSSTNIIIGGSLPSQRNVISGNSSEGIEVAGVSSTGLQIVGNLIGTGLSGTNAILNAGGGVLLTTVPGAVIGGATSAERNIISGNTGTGIELASGCNATIIQGNFIGTDVNGVLDLGNSTDGISITASSNSVITANVISGNGSDGVLISGSTARNNTVTTNRIGTDVSGLVSLGNSDNGILISSAPFNTVGGATAADGNVISANFGDGVEITGATASNNIVRFNLIGTDITGVGDLGNDDNGILVQTSAHDNAIGGSGNTIAFNTLDGIYVSGGTNNAIRANTMFSNGDLGIDLGTGGVTTNDLNDADTGANQLLNFPVITAATNSTTNIVVVGTLTSAASTTFILDFFANYAPDASGSGEAEQYLGSYTNTTDGSGVLNFNADLPVAVTGRYISATATDPFGNTSELAVSFRAASVIPPLTYTVVNVNDSGVGSLRAAIQACNTALGYGNNVIEFNIPGAGPHTIQPLTKLTSILNQTTIAGDTQPGYSGTPLIVLNGALAGGTGTDGLQISAGACVVRALTINGFSGDGIELGVGGTNQVEACYIGLDSTGTASVTNLHNGILITNSAANIIGGSVAGQRNYIAGNAQAGVHIGGASSISNNIVNNHLGLNATGQSRSNLYGIWLRSPMNVVGGTNAVLRNIVSGNGSAGVYLDGATASNNVIQGNFICLDVAGTSSAGAQPTGISINSASANRIGGTEVGARNYIAGYDANGVFISGSSSRSNVVEGNFIGLNVANQAVEHPLDLVEIRGVYLTGGSYNLIGGTNSNSRNIISGNTNWLDQNFTITGYGIEVSAATNSILGNFIGTDPTGTYAIPNGMGVRITAHGTVIGGSAGGAGNLISGNLQHGLESQVAHGTIIQGNKIGTDVTGTLDVGNGTHPTSSTPYDGLHIINGSRGTLIGGTNAGEGNIIAFNRLFGVALSDTFTLGSTRENPIWGNSIFSNYFNGITLQSTLPLVNDLGDADNGPNRKQNYPVLALALTDTNTLTSISGTLNSLTNATFRLEFFDNAAAETNGYGEGQTFLGAMDVTTDSSGNASFIYNHPAGLIYNHVITTTATDSNRNTSEFSASVRVLPWDSVDLGVMMTDSPDPIGAGLSMFYTLIITNAGPTNAMSVYLTNALPVGATFVNATPSQGTFTQSGGIVVCDLGVINSNAFATVSVEAILNTVTVHSNFAQVVSTEFDHYSANNTASELTTAQAIVDVAVSSVDSADPIGTGQFVTYTVTVTNKGPSASSSLSLQQDLDPSQIITAFSLSSGTVSQSGNTLFCDFGGMAANNSATLTVTCVATGVGTNFANSFLTWGDYDPNTADNTFTETTVVTNGPGILQFTLSSQNASETSSSTTLSVERLYGTAGTVGVSLATTNGPAVAGADFSNTIATLTFTNGETLKSVSVPIINDLLAECNEFFSAHLFAPTGDANLLFNSSNVVYIFDNEVSSSGSVDLISATDTNLPPLSGNDYSTVSSVSSDGRYVSFTSYAANLASPDFNFNSDVFVRDLLNQTTTLVSINRFSSDSGNSYSDTAQISGSGRYVVFGGYANDLVQDDLNGSRDVFLRDLQTSATTLLSRNVGGTNSGNSDSFSSDPDRPIISSNANSIVFYSYADDLSTHSDGNESTDVYLHDRTSGTNRLISFNLAGTDAGDSESSDPVVSGNGQVVAFTSYAGDLTSVIDTLGMGDIFLQDLSAGTNQFISLNRFGTGPGNNHSDTAYLNADGRYITFQSSATDMAVNDTTSRRDVFWQDRNIGTNVLVSLNTNGVAGNGTSTVRGITADGRYVVFSSTSSDIVPGDGNFTDDVFVRDMFSNVTVLVSVKLAGTNTSSGTSRNPVISGDGSHVAFESFSTDLTVETKSPFYNDVFVRNLTNGTTRLVSYRNGSTNGPNSYSYDAAISYSGNVTSFTGDPEDSGGGGEGLMLLSTGSLRYSDVWAHTWSSNNTELVSVAGPSTTGSGYSYDQQISASGTHVAFASYSENLLPGDTNTTSDVFLYDVISGTTSLISLSTNGSTSGSGYSDVPDISSSGRYVAFYSDAPDLIGNDDNFSGDIFRRDSVISSTALVSVNTNGVSPGNGYSYDPDITPDGRFIAFETTATDLFANDLNSFIDDIVLRDMASNVVELITINGSGTGSGNSYSYDPVISDDARFIAFESFATNLGPVDMNDQYDVYVRDRLNNTNILCSRNLTFTDSGSGASYDAVISGNGQIVLFFSYATNLVAGDTNDFGDIFAYNTSTHVLQRVSIGLGGEAANGESYNCTISEDGRYVAFQSYATNLVANDFNDTDDVFLRDLVSGTTTLVSVNCNNGNSGNGSSTSPAISRDGGYITFASTASDLAGGFYFGAANQFRYSRLFGSVELVSHNRFVNGGGNSDSFNGKISEDGSVIAFLTSANNLVAADNNNTDDLFVWTVAAGGAQPDLVMDKTASTGAPVQFVDYTYTLAVTNIGSASATSVSVTDVLPVGMTFVSASTSQGTVTNSGGNITASIGTLAIGNGAAVTITVNASATGSITNTASATSSAADATPGNNSDSFVVTVTPLTSPTLFIQPTNSTQLLVSWPAATPSGFVLETTTNLTPVIVWSSVTNSVSTSGTNKFVILNVNVNEPERYYRLKY